jgi:D-alanine-D-alanine ligase
MSRQADKAGKRRAAGASPNAVSEQLKTTRRRRFPAGNHPVRHAAGPDLPLQEAFVMERTNMERSSRGKAAANRTLGPVSDLERHLPPEWWRGIFNAVYLKTDGDVVENSDATEREVDYVIEATGWGPDSAILDLCCGQGRHSLTLARRGYHRVTGVDRSRYLIRLARRRARAEGLDVRFREGDARKFSATEGSFDGVMLLGNSFGYFSSEEDDLRVLKAARRALVSRGVLLLDLTDGDWMRENFEPRSWEWIDQQHFVCRERSLSADRQRLISREVVTHSDKGVIADQFYAERLYSRPGIESLLLRAGFENVRFAGDFAGSSTRGEDLGMMARRILIRGDAPVRAVRPARPRRRQDVTVLLGDPRRPDDVKRGGVFNPEDMVTVQRLKDALETLPDFKFSYLDDHTTMLADLKERKLGLVFNLCDEGFHNDALMELHVPAYLEMLGVEYTGARPASLAICYNKALVRAMAEASNIPTPLETYIESDDQGATIPSVLPALIKPALGDSSIGITQHAVVNDPAQTVAYLAQLRALLPGRPLLVQEYLTGSEYSVSLIGNPGVGFTALPVLEVDYGGLPDGLPKILGYESKWEPDSPYWTDIRYVQAELSENARRDLVDWSELLFERLGCRDYARFDFRADAQGQIKLLEVNPNPGWCWDGKFNLMASFGGYSYADMLNMILEAALSRMGRSGGISAAKFPALEAAG